MIDQIYSQYTKSEPFKVYTIRLIVAQIAQVQGKKTQVYKYTRAFFNAAPKQSLCKIKGKLSN